MMDNFERREIERMYRDGYGPTAIADELGISINTIKSYIRRHPSMKNASRCLYCGKVISQTKGRKVKNSARTPAAVRIGTTSIAKEVIPMEKEDRKHDVYGPENLIRYHTALSFVDRLVSEGFLRPADRAEIYTMIARKYGIELDSIFAA